MHMLHCVCIHCRKKQTSEHYKSDRNSQQITNERYKFSIGINDLDNYSFFYFVRDI